MKINKVVVIGAGTMGGGIAAHCANVGLDVTLLDIPAQDGDRNGIVKSLWERQLKARPAALFTPEVARRVRLGNTEDDLAAVQDADWVVEVILEQLEPKRALMARLDALRRPGTIISSNTSGIPIRAMAEGRSDDFRRHFLGTHFFNPPRYLKLLEIIPTADTAPEVVEGLTAFAETRLGKTVVVCQDTPNFIANRIGVFAMQYRTIAALDNGYTVEEVDVLTGPIIGNPKTGTFRLSDLVGLDVLAHVTGNLYELAPDDESRDLYKLPEPVQKMLANKWLGNKTGGGFYKEVRKGGGKEFHALNLQTLEYQPPTKPRFDVFAETRELELPARLHEIFHNPKWQDDRGAAFIIETTLPLLAYAARRLPAIADSPQAVDLAMRHGFGSEMGPFEMWDAIGLAHGVALMKARDIAVPAWVETLLAQGGTSFYQYQAGRLTNVYLPARAAYAPVQRHRFNLLLKENTGTSRVLKRNASASLHDLGDGVLGFEFHSKANSIDAFMFDIGRAGLDLLARDEWRAMVIANQGRDFSQGANIGMFLMALSDPAGLDKAARDGQQFFMDLRFAPKPIVTVPRQRVFGGGVETIFTGARAVASAETYMGLIEVGVGLVPGWGGCKEMLRRNVSPHLAADERVDALPYLQKLFETIGFAKVSESALQARQLGFLSDQDLIVANDEHVLGVAKQVALDLAEQGYTPPDRKAKSIYALGQRGKAAMQLAIQQFRWGGYISEYDAVIAGRLAHVLCGGDLSSPAWVTEDYLLDLEREAALWLLQQPKTQERIMSILKSGKPLRN